MTAKKICAIIVMLLLVLTVTAQPIGPAPGTAPAGTVGTPSSGASGPSTGTSPTTDITLPDGTKISPALGTDTRGTIELPNGAIIKPATGTTPGETVTLPTGIVVTTTQGTNPTTIIILPDGTSIKPSPGSPSGVEITLPDGTVQQQAPGTDPTQTITIPGGTVILPATGTNPEIVISLPDNTVVSQAPGEQSTLTIKMPDGTLTTQATGTTPGMAIKLPDGSIISPATGTPTGLEIKLPDGTIVPQATGTTPGTTVAMPIAGTPTGPAAGTTPGATPTPGTPVPTIRRISLETLQNTPPLTLKHLSDNYGAPIIDYDEDREQMTYTFTRTTPDDWPLSSTRTARTVIVQAPSNNVGLDANGNVILDAQFTESYKTEVTACYGLGTCKESDYTRQPELEQRYDITRDPTKPENQQIQSRKEYQRVAVYDKDDKLTTIDLPSINTEYEYTKDGYQNIKRAAALGPNGKELYGMSRDSEYDAEARQAAYNSAYDAYYAVLTDLPEAQRKEKAEELAWEQLRDTTNEALKGGASVFDIGNYAQQWGAWMKAYQEFGLVDSLTTLFMPSRAEKIQERRNKLIEKYAYLAGTKPILESAICGQYYPDESSVLLTRTITGQVQPTATITATKSNPIHLKGLTKQQMIDLLGETITIGTTTYNLTTDTIDQDITVQLYHIQATLTTDKNRQYNIQFTGETTKTWYSTDKPIQAGEQITFDKYKYATNNYQTTCLTFNPGITSAGNVKHQLCVPIIEYQGPPTTFERQQLEAETPEFIIEGNI